MAEPLFLLKYAGKVIAGAVAFGVTVDGAIQLASPDAFENFKGKVKVGTGLITLLMAGTYKV